MNVKSLAQDEQEVLDLIGKLQAEQGQVLRTSLSVAGRGRGLEVARPLIRLKSLGLVEEVEQRPFFLLRWFGASTKVILRLTPLAAEVAAAVAATPEPQADVAEVAPDLSPKPLSPIAEELHLPALDEVEANLAAATPVELADPLPESMTPPPLQVSDSGDRGTWQVGVTATADAIPGPEVSEIAPPAAAIEAEGAEVAPTEDPVAAEPQIEAPVDLEPLSQDAATAEPVVAEPADVTLTEEAPAVALAPLAEPEVADPVAPPEDAPTPAEEASETPNAAPLEAAQAETAEVEAPKAPVFKLPPVTAGYTDELGGVAEAFETPIQSLFVDPETVENLREVLGEMGMELTMAGEALIANRLSKGESLVTALMEVVVFAFAHAARYDTLSANPAASSDLVDYAGEVLRELFRLREADAISDAVFEQHREAILALADSSAERSARVEALLLDPIGGSAPTALLPEELRGLEELPPEAEPTLLV